MQQSILTGCHHTVLCDLPAASNGPFSNSCLLGLAPGGVYLAVRITADAVSSYLAISPLPLAGRYLFCCTFHRLAAPGCYPAPCPAVFGLSSPPASRQASAAACSPPCIRIMIRPYCGKYNYLFFQVVQYTGCDNNAAVTPHDKIQLTTLSIIILFIA